MLDNTSPQENVMVFTALQNAKLLQPRSALNFNDTIKNIVKDQQILFMLAGE